MQRVLLIRRALGSSGGAETVFRKYRKALADSCEVEPVLQLSRLKLPTWLKAILFAQYADSIIAAHRHAISVSLERGPCANIYRAGDGVHSVWRKTLGKFSLNPLHLVNPWLERKSMESAKTIIANSQMVAGQIEEVYGSQIAQKVKVVHNSYDPERFYTTSTPRVELRKALNLPQEGPLFIFPASGWKRKGLAQAISITQHCEDIGATLVVVGKGKHPIEHKSVIYRGIVNNIEDYYRASDAMILPTLYDPFSNVVLEALACGCLVVTTAQNGAIEVLKEGVTGFVMESPNAHHAEAAYWLKTHLGCDPKLIAQSVADYTLSHEIAQLQDIFKTILGLHAKTIR